MFINVETGFNDPDGCLQAHSDPRINIISICLKLSCTEYFLTCIQEQFAGAIEDFKKCLELQEKHLESDDRLIAETYPYTYLL